MAPSYEIPPSKNQAHALEGRPKKSSEMQLMVALRRWLLPVPLQSDAYVVGKKRELGWQPVEMSFLKKSLDREPLLAQVT
jgi:hypothetical protein